MKTKVSLFMFLVLLVFISPGLFVYAAPEENNWVGKAFLEVAKPGIVEALVLPELHYDTAEAAGARTLDLQLLGPDQQPRNFELYWREKTGTCSLELKPADITLGENLEFTWEGTISTDILINRVEVHISAWDFVGKISIEGSENGQWLWLKKDAAIYNSGEQSRPGIDVPAGYYEKIRLHFTSFNKDFSKKLLPIGSVTVSGLITGKDYAETFIEPVFKRSFSGDIHEIETILPGTGLEIEAVEFETQARFLGEWQIGRQVISEGEIQFIPVRSGFIPFQPTDSNAVRLPIGQKWPGKSLLLKLNTRGKFIGDLSRFRVKIRQIRMIFYAEGEGRYTVLTGTGQGAAVKEFLGQPAESKAQELTFSTPLQNEKWQPVNILEKYKIKGGPFDSKGFTWKAPVSVPKPGYYRLLLDSKASLLENPRGIRLVEEDLKIQTPFFWGPEKSKDMKLDFSAAYDTRQNRTVVTVRLPYASGHWESIRLQAKGIFKREVELEKPKPSKIGWQKWCRLTWENSIAGETFLDVPLSGYPADQTEIRLTMNHGDNQPVEIEKITAYYPALSLFFIAHRAGKYYLVGGNLDIVPAVYDLSMVRSSLLEIFPGEATLGAVEKLERSAIGEMIGRVFGSEGWGLYIVFGLVTLFLIILIVRLFPKIDKKEQ